MKRLQPPIIVPRQIDLPVATATKLTNGVRLYHVSTPGQEVLRISFVFAAGSAHQTAPFVASTTLNLLSEGTQNLTAQQIAEKIDFYGSYYDVNIDRDYAVVTFCCLEKFFAPTLQLAEEILLHPTFPEKEIAIYCAKRKQRLAVERSRITTQVRELFSQALFGKDHPYGVSYDESAYDRLSREEIVAFYRNYYTANHCFVACSLSDNPQLLSAVQALASKLPAGGSETPFIFPTPHPTKHLFNPFPNAVQSAIRVGRLLFPRTHPDFIGMQVVATALGGYFGSRLIRNLREERGYTYGVFAGMVNLDHAGYLAIATEVASEATQDTVQQIFLEMERLCNEPLPTEELENVKRVMLSEVLRIIDGPFGIVDVTIENVQNRTDNNYTNRFVETVNLITAEKVQDLDIRYLQPSKFTTVVVGDCDIKPITKR